MPFPDNLLPLYKFGDPHTDIQGIKCPASMTIFFWNTDAKLMMGNWEIIPDRTDKYYIYLQLRLLFLYNSMKKLTLLFNIWGCLAVKVFFSSASAQKYRATISQVQSNGKRSSIRHYLKFKIDPNIGYTSSFYGNFCL